MTGLGRDLLRALSVCHTVARCGLVPQRLDPGTGNGLRMWLDCQVIMQQPLP